MKKLNLLITMIVLMLTGRVTSAQTWQLVWSDEFTSGISSDWVFETGNGSGGWGNNELEYYRSQNASVVNGQLVITANKESYGGYNYTSVRMKTQGKKSWKYGKVEARIAMPAFQGVWPAFWMLGDNISTVTWPGCGEIDIMEHVNTGGSVNATIHWLDNSGTYAYYGGSTTTTVTSFHIYSIEWDASAIKWFIDGVKYHEANILNSINGTDEFHKNFFILLNLAIGGNWPGSAIDNTAFPAKMYVDYVRVYQNTGATTTPNVSISSPSSGTTYTAPASITINATATAPTGKTITNVQFYNGNTLLGSDNTSPYNYTWSSVASGTYSLTAKVTDSSGATATSSAVSVIVSSSTTGCTKLATTGDFSTRVSNATSNPTLTFLPARTGVGSSTCILYYSTSSTGTYPGYRVTPNTAYTITASAGKTVYFYYTYSVPEGGEKTTLTNKNSFVVGNCSSLKSSDINYVDSNKKLEIYPVPMRENLTVNLEADVYQKIIIIDITGKAVITENIPNGANQVNLDVSKLARGIYCLKLEGINKVLSQIILK